MTVQRIHLGIDPGVHGGISVMAAGLVKVVKMPETLPDLREFFDQYADDEKYDTSATIEQIIPRPTRWFNPKSKSWESSILKSTCVLYANFAEIKAVLFCLQIGC